MSSAFWGIRDELEDEEDDVYVRGARNANSNKSTDELLAMLESRTPPVGCSTKQADDLLEHFRCQWIDFSLEEGVTVQDHCKQLVGLVEPEDAEGFRSSPSIVEEAFASHFTKLYTLTKLLEATTDDTIDEGMDVEEHMLSTKTENGIARREVMDQLFHSSESGKMMLLGTSAFINSTSSASFVRLSLEERMVTPINNDKKKDHQIVEDYVLDRLVLYQYRLHKGACFEEIFSPDTGKSTHAWKEVCKVKEFIAREVTQEKCYAVYQCYTSGGYNLCENMEKFFIHSSIQSRFPLLNPCRSIQSFKNGLYHAIHMAFYPFGEEEEWLRLCQQAADRLSDDRGGPNVDEFTPPTRKDATLVYYDKVFPHGDLLNSAATLDEIDENELQTPVLDGLLSYQQLSSHSIRNMHMLIGRLLYPNKMYDRWSIILVIIGVAGAGKSSMVDFVCGYFAEEGIFTLGSNAQPEFFLQGAQYAQLLVISEMDKKSQIPQKPMQSWATGERVPINQKGLPVIQHTPDSQMFWVGNVMMEYDNESNGIGRRVAGFPFSRMVMNVDSKIPVKLEDERPTLLLKETLIYRKSARSCPNDLWTDKFEDGSRLCSEQLLAYKEELSASFSPLIAHLTRSERYELCWANPDLDPEEAFLPESIFLDTFRQWCRETNTKFPQWEKSVFATVFTQYNIERRRARKTWFGDELNETFLFGLKLRE